MENVITLYNETGKIELRAEKVEFKNVTAPAYVGGDDIRKHRYSLIIIGLCDNETILDLNKMRDAKDNIYNVKIAAEHSGSECTFTYENMELYEFDYNFARLYCNDFTFTLVLSSHKYIR